MANLWRDVEHALQEKIDALEHDLAARRAAGTVVKEWRLEEVNWYRALLQQAEDLARTY